MHFSPLYTLSLLSISLNNDIGDTEKPDKICSPAFAADDI